MSRIWFVLISSAIMAMPVIGDDIGPNDIPEDKKIIRIESEFGLVNFYHYLHATLRTNSCDTCHHSLKEEGVLKTCQECHPHESEEISPIMLMTGPPKIAKAFHDRCKGCHQYTTQTLKKKAGPVTCSLCHLGKEHMDTPETHPR